MTIDPLTDDGVIKPVTNSLLEVALPTDSPPDIRKIGSGQQLAEARASAGLSVEALAARLRLSPSQVLALDAERWDQLPDLAFVRAALRAYAKQIPVDVTPLIDHVGGFAQPTVLEPTAAIESVARNASQTVGLGRERSGWLDRAKTYRWQWLGAASAVFFVGMSLILLGSQSDPAGTARVQQVPIPGAQPRVDLSAASQGSALQPTIRMTDGQAGNADTARVNSAPALGTPSIGTGGSIIRLTSEPATITAVEGTGAPARVTAAPSQAESVGDDRTRVAGAVTTFPVQMPESEPVHVHFKKRAWIDITHKDGVSLLSGTQDANQSFRLDGTPPMMVQIGNPAGVAIEFRGQLVDLKSKTNEKGVAKFTLN
ncbi:MAG: RodZ domain-containing protein [Burkholderiaceae bacterium]